MKLGEMLVRDGRLSQAQLQGVLAQQAREGGRVGTIMVEMGLIDLDALTVYLGLELGIPIASGAMLERAKRSAVRLLDPTQAARHCCVPLMVQDRQLIAAVADPLDFDNLDELSEITGYRIIPRVAPEIRIYYYVERFYGTPRPQLYDKFGESPRGEQEPVDASLPAPPLPGLPPLAASPISAPGRPPHLRRLASVVDFDNSEALELEAEDLLVALESDDTVAAEAKPLGNAAAPGAVEAGPKSRPSQRIDLQSSPATYVPMSANDAASAIASATDRSQIADSLMRFSTGMFDAAALFIVRDNFAFGWKASGNIPGRAHIEHVLIPLASPSLLQSAANDDDGFFDGPVSPSTLHSYLYKVLGCDEPARATASLVSIGRRVVNIVYGHRTERPPLGEEELADVRRVCRVAAESYARLIAASKQRAR